jgi:hypothetical protein
VRTPGGGELTAGNIVPGHIVLMFWTGSYWMAFNTIPRVREIAYGAAGTYSWTVPNGCFEIDVEVWGAGSVGYGPNANGGSSGGYARKRISTLPGTVYSLTIGAGGKNGGTFAGGVSSFDTLVSATGGPATGGIAGIAGGGVGGDENMDGSMGNAVGSFVFGLSGLFGIGGGAPKGGGAAQPSLIGEWPGGGGGGGTSGFGGNGSDGGIKIRWWA